MKRFLPVFGGIWWSVLLVSSVFAFNMDIGDPIGEKLPYDSNKNYLSVQLDKLHVQKHDSPKWYEKVFLNRQKFGLAYFEFTFADGSAVKQVAFKYEWKDNERYRYEYLIPKEDFPAFLIERRKISRPFTVRLVVKNWEKEEATLAKAFVDKLNLFSPATMTVAPALAMVLEASTIALEFIETAFPTQDTDESGIITISPDNLYHWFTIKLAGSGNTAIDFAKIRFVAEESLFTVKSGLLDATIDQYPELFKGVLAWEALFKEADESVMEDDVAPVVKVLLRFKGFVRSLELTNTDKVLLQAKAVCRWAPNTVGQKKLSAKRFTSVSFDGAAAVINKYRNTLLDACPFPGGHCLQLNTCSAYDFCSMSANKLGRMQAKKYVMEQFTLSIEGKPDMDVTVDDYINRFSMKGAGKWKKCGTEKNATYFFNEPVITVTYNGVSFPGHWVSVNVLKINNEYYIAQVSVSQNKPDSCSD